jgi:hypothetical protein
MTHGGPRPGAGRKPGYRKPNGRKNLVAVRLDDGELETATTLGDGNASAGIRSALARFSEPPASIPEPQSEPEPEPQPPAPRKWLGWP